MFENVPEEKLNEVQGKLFEVLKKLAVDGFDMDRLQLVIRRRRQALLDAVETHPHDFFSRYEYSI